jgi:hypothetical protein
MPASGSLDVHLRFGDGRMRAGDGVFQKASGGVGPVVTDPTKPAGVSLDDRIREVETNLIGWALKRATATSRRPQSCSE